MTEEVFWRNYFYRVSLIKQSADLNSMARGSTAAASPSGSDVSSTTPARPATKPAATAAPLTPTAPEPELSDHESEVSFAGDELSSHEPLGVALDELGAASPQQSSDARHIPVDGTAVTDTSTPTTASVDQSPGQPSGSIPEWEQELQHELQTIDDNLASNDMDLDLEDVGVSEDGWEDELAEMLDDVDFEGPAQ